MGALDAVACFDFGLVGVGFADGAEYPCVRGEGAPAGGSSMGSRMRACFRRNRLEVLHARSGKLITLILDRDN